SIGNLRTARQVMSETGRWTMNQRPIAVGLKVCSYDILEEKTRNVTLVNCLRSLRFRRFPSPAIILVACAVLTEGMGETALTLEVTSLEDMETIDSFSRSVTFPNPLVEAWCFVRFSLSFPEPGKYQFALTAQGDPIAQMT